MKIGVARDRQFRLPYKSNFSPLFYFIFNAANSRRWLARTGEDSSELTAPGLNPSWCPFEDKVIEEHALTEQVAFDRG